MSHSHLPDEAIEQKAPDIHERLVIDLHDNHQMAYLSQSLRIGQDVLREAVKAFGPSVKTIATLSLRPR